MTKTTHQSTSPAQTRSLGHNIAQSSQLGTAIAITGDLGAGKTTLSQGFGEYFGLSRMVSPTYTFIRQYELEPEHQNATLYHIDLYRANTLEEILDLGIEEILDDPSSLTLIEWPEKIIHLLPSGSTTIAIKYINKDEREIEITTI